MEKMIFQDLTHEHFQYVKMVKFLHEKYDVDFISFLDENLMTMDQYSKRTWLNGICEGFHEKGLAPKQKKDGSWLAGNYTNYGMDVG